MTKFDLGGQNGFTNMINESGLYNVIIRSDKPEAKPFRKWVTSEVLPSIRKTGNYSIRNNDNNQTDIAIMKDMFQTMFAAQQETNKQLLQVLNLISSTLPKPYKPPFTKWIRQVYDKVDKIAEIQDLERKNILNQAFQELQDTYDIDLAEYEYEFCQLHNISEAYTINVVNADKQLKQCLDIILDNMLEQLMPDSDDVYKDEMINQKECICIS